PSSCSVGSSPRTVDAFFDVTVSSEPGTSLSSLTALVVSSLPARLPSVRLGAISLRNSLMTKKQKVPPTTTGGMSADNTSISPEGSTEEMKSPIASAHPSWLLPIEANTRLSVGTVMGDGDRDRANHTPDIIDIVCHWFGTGRH